MGKTFRRKDDPKNRYGCYEWRNEERNHPNAGDNYYHSDMPYRSGRWKSTSPVKDEGNSGRRSELRTLKAKIKRDGEAEVDTTSRDRKHKHSDKWNWD